MRILRVKKDIVFSEAEVIKGIGREGCEMRRKDVRSWKGEMRGWGYG